MCSIPIVWNAVIGSQHASIFPGTLLLTSAIVTPRHTSQFAITPLKNARKKPVLPNASYFVSTFALLIAIIFAATTAQPLPPAAAARGATVPALVRLIDSNKATSAVPRKFPIHTQVQFLNEELKIHWTGCPNSCGQAYMGAIGLTGTKTKDLNGNIVEAYNISIGGSQGEQHSIGDLALKAVPSNELKDTLKQLLVEEFSAVKRKNNYPQQYGFLSRLTQWWSKLNKSSNST